MRWSVAYRRAARAKNPFWLFGLLVGLVITPVLKSAEDSARPVAVVGHFTNMTYAGEHAYGYAVQLWRQGDGLLGLFLASEGLEGDTPTGLLEDVKFDPGSGEISFRARLSVGVVYSKKRHGVPSRDLFEFAGVLAGTRLRGTVKRSDALDPEEPPRSDKVVLLRSKSNEGMEAFKSYAEWKISADEILKARGPKW